MFDYYITVARWTLKFNEEEPLRTILTWVRLPKLPIHFFNHVVVARIENHIGHTVCLDLATSEGARARYARVCVEVDLSKPLLGKYMIGGRTFYVEYECLENICYTCGMYGHKLDEFPTTDKSVEVKEPQEYAEAVPPPTGSWMTVTRRNRKKSIKKPTQVPHPQGSRFDALRKEAESAEVPKSKGVPATKTKTSMTLVGGVESIASLVDLTNSIFTPKPSKGNKNQDKPLGDITNMQASSVSITTGKGTKASGVSKDDETLVSVPIMLHEPNFKFAHSGLPQGPGKLGNKNKGKSSKLARVLAGVGLESKAKTKVKNFVPKVATNQGKSTNPGKTVVVDGTEVVAIVDRPLEASC
ncbi:hypothetical protein LINPERHAP1_LOCUS28686 [Linum perenne]